MSLHIEERESEGIVILDLKGPLTLGHGDLELRDRLPALQLSGKVNIILNLKGVTGIDSTGLGTLVFGLARLRKSGGRLALVNLNKSHLELFLLTKLAIDFELFDDEQEAIDSFFPERKLKRFDVLEFVYADYDRSGRTHLLVGNFSNQMLGLYHNEGNNLFVDEAPRSAVGRASLLSLAFGGLLRLRSGWLSRYFRRQRAYRSRDRAGAAEDSI